MTAQPSTTEGRSARIRRFGALVRKESYQIVRDPSSILIAFVLPLILLFLFGYGVSLDTTRTRIGLVIEEEAPLTRDLAAGFQASRYFQVAVGRDRREFEEDLVLGRVRGIVVIPAGFMGDHTAGRHPALQVLVDGSDPNTANFVQNYAQATVANWERQRLNDGGGHPPAIAAEQRFWFNPG